VLNHMNWKSIFLGVICFAVGGMTGVYLSSGSTDSNSQELAQGQDGGSSSTKSKPRFGLSWGGSSKSERTAPKAGRVGADSSMISVPISLLESMSLGKSTRSMGQSILDGNDPVEAALGLTSVEKERIQNDWDRARENVRDIEVKALTTKDLEDGSVLLSLPDLSKQRRDIATQFGNSLTQTLGSERSEAFFAIKQVNNMFAVDAGERSVAVKIEAVGEDQWSYKMSLDDSSGSRVWVGESIPNEIRHLADAAGILPTIEEVVKSVPEE
jgi:hypothetical protein